MSAQCSFYEFQKKLRELGWYVEWTYASQESHIWEDMPFEHEVGPFEGEEIHQGKVLVSFTGDVDAYKVPSHMSEEEVYDWYDCVRSFLEDEDKEGLDQYLEQYGHPELPPPTPEGWGGNEFLCPWDEMIEEVIIPVAEATGCRVTPKACSCWIEWGDPNSDNRFYPANKDRP